jgi:hypothetical protein
MFFFLFSFLLGYESHWLVHHQNKFWNFRHSTNKKFALPKLNYRSTYFPLAWYIDCKSSTLGQVVLLETSSKHIGNMMRTIWKLDGKTLGTRWEQFENLMGKHWEHDENNLKTWRENNIKIQNPTPQTKKYINPLNCHVTSPHWTWWEPIQNIKFQRIQTPPCPRKKKLNILR